MRQTTEHLDECALKARTRRSRYPASKRPICATRAVLPAMLAAGTGTLLYTTGGSSVTPAPVFVSAGMAGAALRKWAVTLNRALAGKGIYVGHVAIGTWIAGTPRISSQVAAEMPETRSEVYAFRSDGAGCRMNEAVSALPRAARPSTPPVTASRARPGVGWPRRRGAGERDDGAGRLRHDRVVRGRDRCGA